MVNNRLDRRLAELAAQGRKALVTYIVAGDPDRGATLPAMRALVAAGADVIELGIPFSDPMAEGPVIQRGHERALAGGESLSHVLETVRQFRAEDSATPVVLMGYANPVERMGYSAFAARAAEAGVDGALTVDLPPEEAADLQAELKSAGLHSIFLLAPTSSAERVQSVAASASGFIYYVSLKGVTGAGHLDTSDVSARVAAIQRVSALPVMVGFGIKDAASARAVAATAPGVVVGSALVAAMGEGGDVAARLAAVVKPIRAALDELTQSR